MENGPQFGGPFCTIHLMPVFLLWLFVYIFIAAWFLCETAYLWYIPCFQNLVRSDQFSEANQMMCSKLTNQRLLYSIQCYWRCNFLVCFRCVCVEETYNTEQNNLDLFCSLLHNIIKSILFHWINLILDWVLLHWGLEPCSGNVIVWHGGIVTHIVDLPKNCTNS